MSAPGHRLTLTLVVGASLLLWAASPLPGRSAPTNAQLDQRIAETEAKVLFRKSRERVLTRDISRYSDRIAALQQRVDGLAARQGTLERRLTRQRAALNATQGKLRLQRARLVRLQRRLRQVRSVLSERLVRQYKDGRMDLASVVIDADGFAQLLERGEYLSRLMQNDRKIIAIVNRARRDAIGSARRLAALQNAQRTLEADIAARRNAVAGVRRTVASVASDVRVAAGNKRALLRLVIVKRKDLQEDLGAMRAQQAKIQRELTRSQPLAPTRPSNGRFLWPINGTITSPYCERRSYEACHPGLDIAAPTGTPIRAPDSGRVAIAGMVGGYGNYTCLQHSASLSSCYGHQSRLLVSVGQQVTRGQVIGLVGSTGRSTGPHLHFEVRNNGAVTNPMNYL